MHKFKVGDKGRLKCYFNGMAKGAVCTVIGVGEPARNKERGVLLSLVVDGMRGTHRAYSYRLDPIPQPADVGECRFFIDSSKITSYGGLSTASEPAFDLLAAMTGKPLRFRSGCDVRFVAYIPDAKPHCQLVLLNPATGNVVTRFANGKASTEPYAEPGDILIAA